MPKRTNKSKIKHYKEKIKKLEESNRRRRVIVYSDSESDIENVDVEPINTLEKEKSLPPVVELENVIPKVSDITEVPPNITEVTDIPIDVSIDLDPEIREALGDHLEDSPKYGEEIHKDLAQRWLPILRKGLEKETKEKLLKEQNVPDNCRLLKASTLNPEIAAAVAEVVRARDKKMQTKQHQLGLGITAISRAMTLMLKSEAKKVEVIKLLSEGCRILSDLHFTETQTRTNCITPCLDKSILNIIQEEERDETLFGNTLSEKIKAAKAIEKQGWQIKRSATIPQKAVLQSKVRNSGNWNPPPRYASSVSRGGRGSYPTNRFPMNTNFRFRSQVARPPQTPVPGPGQSATATRSTIARRAPTRQ